MRDMAESEYERSLRGPRAKFVRSLFLSSFRASLGTVLDPKGSQRVSQGVSERSPRGSQRGPRGVSVRSLFLEPSWGLSWGSLRPHMGPCWAALGPLVGLSWLSRGPSSASLRLYVAVSGDLWMKKAVVRKSRKSHMFSTVLDCWRLRRELQDCPWGSLDAVLDSLDTS